MQNDLNPAAGPTPVLLPTGLPGDVREVEALAAAAAAGLGALDPTLSPFVLDLENAVADVEGVINSLAAQIGGDSVLATVDAALTVLHTPQSLPARVALI